MANGVLALGSPLHPGCYKATSCRYSIAFDGPGFSCTAREVSAHSMDCNIIYEAVDHARISNMDPNRYPILGNSFTVTWRSRTPTQQQLHLRDCEAPQSVDCHMTIGTYTLNVEKKATETPIFSSEFIQKDKMAWTNDSPILSSFYDYFWFDRDYWRSPKDPTRLTIQFARTQAFALRDAAVRALAGRISIGTSLLTQKFEHYRLTGSLLLQSTKASIPQ
jgi:hypothetical protein